MRPAWKCQDRLISIDRGSGRSICRWLYTIHFSLARTCPIPFLSLSMYNTELPPSMTALTAFQFVVLVIKKWLCLFFSLNGVSCWVYSLQYPQDCGAVNIADRFPPDGQDIEMTTSRTGSNSPHHYTTYETYRSLERDPAKRLSDVSLILLGKNIKPQLNTHFRNLTSINKCQVLYTLYYSR